ncbi:MAG: Flp pilus assembly protein CpaB [Dehalococcoidia bacterium]|nr:MAG: Flp pilus assembly protein CpaB [Dehalococcoidia bacterium]
MKRLISGSALLMIATVLGIATTAAAFAWLSRAGVAPEQEVAATQRGPVRPAVVVVADVPAGTQLTAKMLEVRDIPEVAYLPGTAAEIPSVVGRVTRYPLISGEQVGTHKLVAEGRTGEGLAFAVPPGMRAVSVSINEVRGAGGLIVPGDRVDVMVHTDYQRLFGPSAVATIVASEEKKQPTVITVLQDVMVLAIGQVTTPPIDGQSDAAALRPDEAAAQPKAASATLAVSATQAQALFFAAQEGTIGLMLRPFGDTTSTRLEPLLRLEPLGPATGAQVRN